MNLQLVYRYILPVYFKSVRKWKNVKNKTKQNKLTKQLRHDS